MKKIFNKKGIIIIFIITFILIAITFLVSYLNDTKSEISNICTIQFESNGGTEISSQDVICGSYATKPDLPIKPGFIFIDWYYENKVFDFNTIKINTNITLTANWKVNENTITVVVHFDSEGGSSVNDIEIAKNSKIIPPIAPIKSGYIFDGWYYNGERFDFLKNIDKEITLTAKWLKNENIDTNETNNNSNNNSLNQNINSNNNINSTCEYSMKTNEYTSTPQISFGIGEETSISSSWGFWSYTSNSCKITYKSDNTKIIDISTSGVASGKKSGNANIYICIIDKATNTELDCFKIIANIKYMPGTERAIKDSQELVNAIKDYYWYLDGYTYAYIHPTVIDWYDHKALNWDSEYIDLVNDTFVATEKTGTVYYNSRINNSLLANPVDSAYDLIANYNMNVSKNKLYITIGGKTYSFTKYTSKKLYDVTLSINNLNIVVDEDEWLEVDVNVSPFFANHNITATVSNSSILSYSGGNHHSKDGKVTLSFYAWNPGSTIITINDVESGISKTINVTVNKVNKNVSNISLNKENLSLLNGDSETLIATITPSNAANKKVIWSSDNTNVATVSASGKVTAIGKGTATISVTTEDGGYTAHCIVKVTNKELTVDASIGHYERVSDSSISEGIVATLNATGGSNSYTYYYIKLYKDGTLIGQTTNTTDNTLSINGHKNGNYYVEYTVKDSEGNEKSGTSSVTTVLIQ